MIADAGIAYSQLAKELDTKGILTSVCIVENISPDGVFEQMAKEGKGFFLQTDMAKFSELCGKKIKGLAQ